MMDNEPAYVTEEFFKKYSLTPSPLEIIKKKDKEIQEYLKKHPDKVPSFSQVTKLETPFKFVLPWLNEFDKGCESNKQLSTPNINAGNVGLSKENKIEKSSDSLDATLDKREENTCSDNFDLVGAILDGKSLMYSENEKSNKCKASGKKDNSENVKNLKEVPPPIEYSKATKTDGIAEISKSKGKQRRGKKKKKQQIVKEETVDKDLAKKMKIEDTDKNHTNKRMEMDLDEFDQYQVLERPSTLTNTVDRNPEPLLGLVDHCFRAEESVNTSPEKHRMSVAITSQSAEWELRNSSKTQVTTKNKKKKNVGNAILKEAPPKRYEYPIHSTPYPRPSSLTIEEQKCYIELMDKFTQQMPFILNSSVKLSKEQTMFKDLYQKVRPEQDEYLNYLCNIAYKYNSCYFELKPKLGEYIKEVIADRKLRVKNYPRYYVQHDSVALIPVQTPHLPAFFHIKTLLNLGVIPTMNDRQHQLSKTRFVLNPEAKPTLEANIPPDYPLLAGKKVCSEDPNAEQLSSKHKVQIVISSSALCCLVDNHPPFDRQWEIPVEVREQIMEENGKVKKKKVVYIDKPFIPRQTSVRRRNEWVHKFMLKHWLQNNDINLRFRQQADRKGSLLEMENMQQYGTNSRRQFSANDNQEEDDEMYSIEDLETFGTGPISSPSNKRKLSAVSDSHEITSSKSSSVRSASSLMKIEALKSSYNSNFVKGSHQPWQKDIDSQTGRLTEADTDRDQVKDVCADSKTKVSIPTEHIDEDENFGKPADNTNTSDIIPVTADHVESNLPTNIINIQNESTVTSPKTNKVALTVTAESSDVNKTSVDNSDIADHLNINTGITRSAVSSADDEQMSQVTNEDEMYSSLHSDLDVSESSSDDDFSRLDSNSESGPAAEVAMRDGANVVDAGVDGVVEADLASDNIGSQIDGSNDKLCQLDGPKEKKPHRSLGSVIKKRPKTRTSPRRMGAVNYNEPKVKFQKISPEKRRISPKSVSPKSISAKNKNIDCVLEVKANKQSKLEFSEDSSNLMSRVNASLHLLQKEDIEKLTSPKSPTSFPSYKCKMQTEKSRGKALSPDQVKINQSQKQKVENLNRNAADAIQEYVDALTAEVKGFSSLDKEEVDTPIKHVPGDTPIKHILANTAIKQSPADTPLKHVPADTEIKHISADTPIKHVPADTEIKHISADTEIKQIFANTPIKHVPADTEIKQIFANTPIKHVPVDTEIKQLPADTPIKHVPADTEIEQLPADTPIKHVPADTEIKQLPADTPIKHIPTRRFYSSCSSEDDKLEIDLTTSINLENKLATTDAQNNVKPSSETKNQNTTAKRRSARIQKLLNQNSSEDTADKKQIQIDEKDSKPDENIFNKRPNTSKPSDNQDVLQLKEVKVYVVQGSLENKETINTENVDPDNSVEPVSTGCDPENEEQTKQLDKWEPSLILNDSDSDIEVKSPTKKLKKTQLQRRMEFSDEENSDEEQLKKALEAQKKWIESVRKPSDFHTKTTTGLKSAISKATTSKKVLEKVESHSQRKAPVKVKPGLKKIDLQELTTVPISKPSRVLRRRTVKEIQQESSVLNEKPLSQTRTEIKEISEPASFADLITPHQETSQPESVVAVKGFYTNANTSLVDSPETKAAISVPIPEIPSNIVRENSDTIVNNRLLQSLPKDDTYLQMKPIPKHDTQAIICKTDSAISNTLFADDTGGVFQNMSYDTLMANSQRRRTRSTTAACKSQNANILQGGRYHNKLPSGANLTDVERDILAPPKRTSNFIRSNVTSGFPVQKSEWNISGSHKTDSRINSTSDNQTGEAVYKPKQELKMRKARKAVSSEGAIGILDQLLPPMAVKPSQAVSSHSGEPEGVGSQGYMSDQQKQLDYSLEPQKPLPHVQNKEDLEGKQKKTENIDKDLHIPASNDQLQSPKEQADHHPPMVPTPKDQTLIHHPPRSHESLNVPPPPFNHPPPPSLNHPLPPSFNHPPPPFYPNHPPHPMIGRLYQAPIHMRDPKEWEMFESTEGYQAPKKHNVTYNLWQLGNHKVLIRCGIHLAKVPLKQWKKGKIQCVHLMPKLEYQNKHGFEVDTVSEITRAWISLAIRENCALYKARITVHNSEIATMDHVSLSEAALPRYGFSDKASVTTLAGVFEKLYSLQPGHYLLSHSVGNTQAHIKKTSNSNVGVYDLHNAYQNVMTDKEGVPWVPIDVNRVTLLQRHFNRVPCTFEPKDSKTAKVYLKKAENYDFQLLEAARMRVTRKKKKKKFKQKKNIPITNFQLE